MDLYIEGERRKEINNFGAKKWTGLRVVETVWNYNLPLLQGTNFVLSILGYCPVHKALIIFNNLHILQGTYFFVFLFHRLCNHHQLNHIHSLIHPIPWRKNNQINFHNPQVIHQTNLTTFGTKYCPFFSFILYLIF